MLFGPTFPQNKAATTGRTARPRQRRPCGEKPKEADATVGA